MWANFLTRLANEYGGKAGLLFHDFENQAGEILETSGNVSASLRKNYSKLASNHPWGQYMWALPSETPIFPDERKVKDRISNDIKFENFIKFLMMNELAIGMGAVLWKNKHPNPRYVVSVGVLRNGNPYVGECFSEKEKSLFVQWIPPLVKDIQNHDRVKKLAG